MSNYDNVSTKWMITGITSGVGAELAEQLLEAGQKVVGLVRTPMKVRALMERYPEQIYIYPFDLTRLDKIEEIVSEILKEHPDISYITSNAGISVIGAAENVSYTDIQNLMNTNLIGSVLFIKSVIPHIRRNGGRIIQISSLAGEIAIPMWSYYVASKHGINGFCESVSRELSGSNAQIMIVEPGAINTPLWEKVAQSEEDELRTRARKADIDVKKLARTIINTAFMSAMPLYLSLGSKCNKNIIAHLEKQLRMYKEQSWYSSTVDADRKSSMKMVLPENIGNRQLAMWPVGGVFMKSIRIYDWREIDSRLNCLADSDPDKIGKVLLGRTIVSPEDIIENKEDIYIVITSSDYGDELAEILNRAGRIPEIDYCLIDHILRGEDE